MKSTSHPGTALVIGGGVAGLATANLLAQAGWNVTVLEQSTQLGGRAGTFTQDGFTFDTGPSWYLMTDVFEHYFSLFGHTVSDFMQLERLSPAYRVFSGAADPVTVSSNIEQDAATFESLEPGAGKQLRRHVERASQIYQMAKQHFLYVDHLVPRSFVQPDVVGSLRALPKTLRLNSYVERHFKHPVLRQILQYYSVFLGVSPYRAPSLYALMSHLDFSQGVFYPRGGMYEIVKALERLGQEVGVRYALGAEVSHINTLGGRAIGVTLADASTLSADLVVSAADLHHTEQTLLDPDARSLPDRFWRSAKPSPSALLLYLGIQGRLPQLVHHNLVFTKDWESNFADIFDRDTWPNPASMYVSAPTRTDPSVAPAGDENLFVLIPLPPSATPPTQKQQTQAADMYLDQLAQAIGEPNLKARIVVKRLFGPADFARQFHAWRGNALGLGHTWGQSAWWRPAVKSKRLSNFYTVGGDVRPGIGLPMCLISAQLVMKDLNGDRSDGPAQPKVVGEASP
jgi:phytoene desaturase